jgi:tight adherence protein C
MQADPIFALAVALASLGLAMLAAVAIARLAAERRGARVLAAALDRHAAPPAVPVGEPAGPKGSGLSGLSGASAASSETGTPAPKFAAAKEAQARNPWRRRTLRAALARLAALGMRLLDTPFGRQAVAAEDRRLLDQCGFVDANARGVFLVLRLGCAVALAALAGWFAASHARGWLISIAALTAGFMLPKLMLARRAATRRRGVAEELPMLVDLLRLLQGVGLSLDQSLQVMINDFRVMLPVLCSELEIAQRQFVAGRTREQSLHRLATSFGNEDLRAVVRLMIQVDRHGGAVQEPLRQFGDRLRESRRAMLRERIGRLTVKMTGVMILTLLPALLVVTAGPGIITAVHILTPHRR